MNPKISIALRDASVAYIVDGQLRPVLLDIELEIPAGQFVVILGDNGSGKSTLLRAMAGLLPLSRGTVERMDDRPIPVVYQNPDAQIVGETVMEDVCFGLENLAVPTEQMAPRANEALAAVGLAGSGDRFISSLSGGQKQLVCIASAIVMNPSVIIMDEPTAMLDPTSKGNVISIVQKLNESGKTVVWATHGMDEVSLADRVIVLSAGRVVFDDTPEKFFYGDGKGDSPCESLGFVPPYPIRVIQGLHRKGLSKGQYPVSMSGCLEVVSRLWQS